MRQTIEIKYSCVDCGLMDVAVDVPVRDQEDVKAWMDQAVQHIAQDHCFRSPCCRATHITNIKIPIDGRQKVGGPVVQ